MQAGDTSRLLSRISYCTADKMHDKVFAYIAQSQHSESLECHAFLCTKRKVVSGGARPRGDRLRDLKTGGNPQESQWVSESRGYCEGWSRPGWLDHLASGIEQPLSPGSAWAYSSWDYYCSGLRL